MTNSELLVVGSGMGGSLTAALNQEKEPILLESDRNLGGCAATFKRFGHFFNAGATTLVGYESNHPLKKAFDKIGYEPELIGSDIAIQIIQNGQKIDRTKDLGHFLEILNKVHPHPNNEKFWRLIYELDQKFWQLKGVHFAKYSLGSYLRSFQSFLELYKGFGNLLFFNAQSFIDHHLPNITPAYQEFLDAQLLITVQSRAKNLSSLSLILGLAYPFHDVYYAKGGMGSVIEGILHHTTVHKKTKVEHITRKSNGYLVQTNKEEYFSKQLVLNSTIFDSKKLFEDKQIINYYQNFTLHDQSAFTVYLKIDSSEQFLHHYQIIEDQAILNGLSNSIFLSFSDLNDEKMSKKGYSITVSTHTEAKFWEGLEKEQYEKRKQQTEDYIIQLILDNFDTIKEENIITRFSGTSKTFLYYANRLNCGGQPLNIKRLLQSPTCTTPFKGLYNIGDTVFPGQGWPGVTLGVDVLLKEMNA